MNFNIPQTDGSEVEFVINKGEKTVFLGANGTGKSRLGEYIETTVFNQTTQGYESNSSRLKTAEYQLANIESKIFEITSQIQNIEKMTDDEIVNYGTRFQEGLIPFQNGEVITRKKLLELFFQGSINVGNVKFSNNRMARIIPPQSLNDIDGGTISFGGQTFFIDLMKVQSGNKKSIEAARAFLMGDQRVILSETMKEKEQALSQIEELKLNLMQHTDNNFAFCQRVSAHRSLVIPYNLNPKSPTEALNELFYGPNGSAQNRSQKTNGVGKLQSDYDKLLISLFSDEADKGTRYLQGEIEKENTKTFLASIVDVWNTALPHRKLLRHGLEVHVECNKSKYDMRELSEGERSIFYLVGQCLIAPPNTLIILDEPDLHVHKAILQTIFDIIENQRSDCAFIYITHDLDFVISRNASKYVILEYSHQNLWKIESLKDHELPEEIITLISGSRRPILFTEGEKNSFDQIYKLIYPTMLVIPVGSSNNVKTYTKSLNKNLRFTKVECFGLIDGDGMNQEDIDSLKKNKIHVIPVALIENIFLIPEVFKILHEHFADDTDADAPTYLQKLIDDIKRDQNWVAKNIKDQAQKEVQQIINDFENNIISIKGQKINFDLNKIHNEILESHNKIEKIEDRDEQLKAWLKVYRSKSGVNLLKKLFKVHSPDDCKSKLLDAINNNPALAAELTEALPQIA